jgi:hypothetical protein
MGKKVRLMGRELRYFSITLDLKKGESILTIVVHHLMGCVMKNYSTGLH